MNRISYMEQRAREALIDLFDSTSPPLEAIGALVCGDYATAGRLLPWHGGSPHPALLHAERGRFATAYRLAVENIEAREKDIPDRPYVAPPLTTEQKLNAARYTGSGWTR